MRTIEQLITEHVGMTPSTRGGWSLVKCPVCNDYKKRAGFKFSDGGESVVYHCFNQHTCGGAYNPSSTEGNMSRNMRKVLECFNIPEQAIKEFIFDKLKEYRFSSPDNKPKPTFPLPNKIDFPNYFIPLSAANCSFGNLAREYLLNRKIDPNSYKFYILDNKYSNSKWKNRLIIPAYYKNEIIFYQGRDLLDLYSKKYLSCEQPISQTLYNFDCIHNNPYPHLFVFEGFFDGWSICPNNFVNCMSSNLSTRQIYYLNLTNKTKVIVPDMIGNGIELAEQAIELGWSVCFPKLRGCKDINEYVVKYGKINGIQELLENIKYGDEAKMYIQMVKSGLYN